MDSTVYLFNPVLWTAYTPPRNCFYCGLSTAEGQHSLLASRPDGSVYWRCHVPMLRDQPKLLGRINSEEPY